MDDISTTGGLPFRGFSQLAYVTSDLRRAQDVFADRFDVPEFADLGELALALEGGHEARVRIALCFVGTLQLEIIEPRGGHDDLYRRHLPRDGFGLVWHHVGFKVASIAALTQAREQLSRLGHDVVLAGGNPEAAMFFYVDGRATLGHYLEYIYLSPARQAFHDALPHHRP